jgi:arylsulfatase A-like enzyme
LVDRPLYQYYPSYDFNWGLTPSASILRGDYKLIEFFGDRIDQTRQYIAGHHIELYNLRTDIGEQYNLATTDPDRAADLSTQLHAWMDELGVKASGPNPHHDPEKAFATTTKIPEWVTIR